MVRSQPPSRARTKMPPATLTPADPEIEIFAAGTHTAASGVAITMTPADLAGIAAAYDPGRHEAPLVIGHPTTNVPAYGWVQQLRVTGDRLLARPHQVNPEFAELVRSGAYKKRSASFWGPSAPGNPTPGRFALRHVGFLGAMPPAVKGLKACNFADGDDVTVFEFADQPREEERRMDEDMKKRLEAAEAKAQAAEDKLRTSEADKARLAAVITDFAERDRTNRRAADRVRLDGLLKEGRVLPRETAALGALVQFLGGVPDGVVEFSEGDGTAKVTMGATDLLFDLLGKRPKIVSFQEHAPAAGGGTIDFSDPIAIADAAAAYEAQMSSRGTPVTSSAAVLHVMKGRP